jgi:hypothetical protein
MRSLLLLALALVLAAPAAALAAPPPNDSKDTPTIIDGLPARLQGTTVDATTEPDDPGSRCAASRNSVYYQLRAGADGRIFVQLAASGDLDGVVDVFKKVRSQLQGIGCDATDENGNASVGFNVKDGDVFLIRVAQLNNSVSGTFALNVDRAQPAAKPPGTPLPAGGRRDSVDRILNPSDAWNVRLRAGRTYRINLTAPVDPDRTRCVRLRLYPPGTRNFGQSAPVRRAPCGGYILYTPKPENSGRYVLLVDAVSGRGTLPYNLEVAPAGPDDTAPGIFVRNDRTEVGELVGNRIDVVDLYRFDVTKRSVLNLTLATSANFDLILLSDRGHQIECACFGNGDEKIQRRIAPGRYFAAVRAQQGAVGHYRLTRISRTITRTVTRLDGHRNGRAAPGAAVTVGVHVTPAVGGPITVLVERFDPLAGWLFYSRLHTTVAAGTRSISFTPPTVGRWRVRAKYQGTRVSSPSLSPWARILVAGPLSE